MNARELIDELIERGKKIVPRELRPSKEGEEKDDKDLKQIVDELIAYGETAGFDDWEMEIVTRLRDDIPRYSWIGFYWVRGEHLYLGAWDGPAVTNHTEIPIGTGICGQAAQTKKTVVVDDVDNVENYLACFPSTRSEIVVPILLDGEAIGEIDIDGDKPGAFGDEDARHLERLANAMANRLQPL